MNYHYDLYPSPVGELVLIASEQGLCAIVFTDDGEDWQDALPARFRGGSELQRDLGHVDIHAAERWLDRYFAGEKLGLDDYEGRLDPDGTDFQRAVWERLAAIPYGRTTSYGEVARALGDPKKTRAVGLANGANPLPILLPCHRVIGASGKLVGFGGGIHRKERLLAIEQGGRLFLD